MTFEEATEDYIRFKTVSNSFDSIQTKRMMLRIVLQFVGGEKPVNKVSHRDINSWMEHELAQKHSPNYVRRVRDELKFFFHFALVRKFVESNPMANNDLLFRVAPQKTKRLAFTREQYQIVLDRTAGLDRRYYYHPASIIAWHTGLRAGDVSNLKWENIDWSDEFIRLSPRKTRKYHPCLEIPIEPELMELFYRLKEKAEDKKFVLPIMAFDYFSPGSRARIYKDFSEKICAGFGKGYSFHSFRHAFVTRMLEAGVDPCIIGSITGQTVQQVLEYGSITRRAKRNAFAQMREASHKEKLDRLGITPPTIRGLAVATL